MKNTIYDYTAMSIQGKEIALKEYEGYIVLIVNTASKCGFTPQLDGLEKLYRELKDKKVVVLGFPCNQFGNQEPGDTSSIINGCMLNYGVSFPMFQKIEVNGKNAHPLFKYLKKTLPGFPGNRIKWNFTKFLIDHNGTPIKRYASWVKPEKIANDILKKIL